MKFLTTLSYLLSSWFIGSGFYKLFVYEVHTSSALQDLNKNAYVGGDAYNYIINSERATAYFVLATLFFLIGTVPIILKKIEPQKIQE